MQSGFVHLLQRYNGSHRLMMALSVGIVDVVESRSEQSEATQSHLQDQFQLISSGSAGTVGLSETEAMSSWRDSIPQENKPIPTSQWLQ